MTTDNDLYDDIKKELAALKEMKVKPWMQVGLLLDKIDRSCFWNNQRASSFTDWLKRFGYVINLKEASLWRYLTAARYYQELHQDLTRRGELNSPPCNLLNINQEKSKKEVSPENIEILSKLVRAVPDDIFLKLAKDVINGDISRAKLRQTWEAYRPAMRGRTAQGKSVQTPKIDLTDNVQSNLAMEAQVLTALLNSGYELICNQEPCLYKLFPNVRPDFADSPTPFRNRFSFSAVAIVRPSTTEPLEFHGIAIYGHDYFGSDDSLWTERKSYCDHIWLAIHRRTMALGDLHLPPHVGLMVADENGIKVVRTPGFPRQSGAFTGYLVKGLLLKAMHV